VDVEREQQDNRDLNRGFSDAMAHAVELALTPAIFGFVGYLLDGWLGTGPFLMLGLGLFTVVYVAWRMMKGYDAEMQVRERALFDRRSR